MSLDKDFVLTALLQHNFLPTQKKAREELPPIFTSISFTADVARKLVNGTRRTANGFQGYDAVDYRLTRFNGVSRSCSIPHPMAYAHFSLCIHEHWDKIDYIASNENSHIRPRQHTDGRIAIMDYERSSEKTLRSLGRSFGASIIHRPYRHSELLPQRLIARNLLGACRHRPRKEAQKSI